VATTAGKEKAGSIASIWRPSFRTQSSSRRRRCSSRRGGAEGASLRKIRQQRGARLRVRLFLCGPCVIPVNVFVPFPLPLSLSGDRAVRCRGLGESVSVGLVGRQRPSHHPRTHPRHVATGNRLNQLLLGHPWDQSIRITPARKAEFSPTDKLTSITGRDTIYDW
jgi:hypothetical protein